MIKQQTYTKEQPSGDPPEGLLDDGEEKRSRKCYSLWNDIVIHHERNKIKILLRSELVCAIIWVFKLLARLINQQTAESRLVKACFDVSYIRNSHYRFGGTKYEALFRLPIDSS